MTEPKRNLYFVAVEERDQGKADELFFTLVEELMAVEPELSWDHAKEKVVAGIMYVSGYYGPEVRGRAAKLYSHHSKYRRSA